jgi:outer membrane protein assembly factor BamA
LIIRGLRHLTALLCLAIAPLVAAQDEVANEDTPLPLPSTVPDIRDEDARLKVQRGDFVIVPIPVSNPTFDTGLVLGGAYFYAQTEEQKKVQPASLTGFGAAYTSNDSYAIALAQQSYWDENRWRLDAVAGYVDFSLTLSEPDGSGGTEQTAWGIRGGLAQATLLRRIGASRWYAGGLARYINIEQSLDLGIPDPDYDISEEDEVAGIGLLTQYDSRDRPFNSGDGRFLKADAIYSETNAEGENSYWSFNANFRSYHTLTDSLVLAWEARACARDGNVPLWNACFIGLRGFALTEYIGQRSASAQAELRWKMSRRWGAVGFAGAGYAAETLAALGGDQHTPSYGVGIRFQVLESQGINLRLDFARSDNDEAFHLSVAEAF